MEIGFDEWDAVRLFWRLGSQWNFHVMSGVRLGLKYEAVPPTAAMMEIDMRAALFDDIATMERAALAAFAGA